MSRFGYTWHLRRGTQRKHRVLSAQITRKCPSGKKYNYPRTWTLLRGPKQESLRSMTLSRDTHRILRGTQNKLSAHTLEPPVRSRGSQAQPLPLRVGGPVNNMYVARLDDSFGHV